MGFVRGEQGKKALLCRPGMNVFKLEVNAEWPLENLLQEERVLREEMRALKDGWGNPGPFIEQASFYLRTGLSPTKVSWNILDLCAEAFQNNVECHSLG